MKEPLAYRMRPKNIKQVIGQDHVLGENKILERAIKSDTITSLILYGPPGVGKTSIAEVIANTTQYKFHRLNAVSSGVQDIKDIVEETKNIMFNPKGKSIIFIDEIHRFNKKQQDVLLPYVESGLIILIGATTENPYYAINKALISRSMVIELKKIDKKDILKVLKRALLEDEELKKLKINISEDILKKIALISNGDVRFALSGLERTVFSSMPDEKGEINITDEIIKEAFQLKKNYDKTGEEHYNNISAFIKSVRGSDPDAGIHYLAKILEAGEDPMFVARRLVILASEDIGLANPEALNIATSALIAIKNIGMPEARIPLAEATIYLALSKKSNTAYLAINKAIEDLKTRNTGEVPLYLRNATFEAERKNGVGVGYLYPHDYKNGKVSQEYLPEEIRGTKYYIDRWGMDFKGENE